MSSRLFLLMLLTVCASAQNAGRQTRSSSVPKVDNEFVHRQFGSTCSLDPNFVPMTADLNGDGVEDLVLIARCKNPLIDQDEKNYKVIDPMNSFFGYGNPKVTSSIGQEDPRLKGMSILVIHGAGADAWRSATPVAKFVIINIDIKTVTLKKTKISRKKSAPGIYIEEATGDQMTSVIFWDGKKYKYEPLGSAME